LQLLRKSSGIVGYQRVDERQRRRILVELAVDRAIAPAGEADEGDLGELMSDLGADPVAFEVVDRLVVATDIVVVG
jgi:hypothetical protein